MADFLKRAGSRPHRLWRIAPWAIAVLLLLTPLVAMQFTGEVVWDETDFIVAGAMLFGACAAFELAMRITRNNTYLAAVGVAVAASLVLIWLNLAVGIIGSEDHPANLMYAGVLAVGFIAAALGRFRPDGMARAMVAMAIAQTFVAAIALIAGLESPGPSVVLGAFFAALWLISAWLFRKAAQEQGPAGRSAPA